MLGWEEETSYIDASLPYMSSRVFGGIERDKAEPQPRRLLPTCMRMHIVKWLQSVLSSVYASAFHWTKVAGGVEWGVVEVGDVGELVAS